MATLARKEYFLDRYYERRIQFISLLGGKCVDCNVEDELEFDHNDPSTKSFNIGSHMFDPMEKLLEELKKCVLRCKVCHNLKSAAEKSVGHGQGLSGKKNCKCEFCKARKNEYMRNWKRNKRSGLTQR